MFRSLSRVAIALVTWMLAQGCTLAVEQSQPRPNIDLPEKNASLALVMDKGVEDQYEADLDGKHPVNVTGWRETLQNGFHSGFSSAFKTNADRAELTLQLNEAVLSFAPTSLGRHGGIQAAEAQVRYKARLLDAQGRVLRRSTGTVSSKKSATDKEGLTTVASSAVESMYEKIAQDFFSEAPAAALGPAPAATPAQ
ncbi:MAG: hypothetical protein ACJ8AT_23270 [Hyalangium sp.]|uniref:hypothetical protein n=1 Tax=Hyalangium sp. TaxID=2028555 RepID=UPI00389A942F